MNFMVLAFCILLTTNAGVAGIAREGRPLNPSDPFHQELILERLQSRRKIVERALEPAGGVQLYSEPHNQDLAEALIDEVRYRKLEDMARAGLTEAKLPFSPWSSSYWPYFGGAIAMRYAAPGYEPSMNWRKNRDFVTESLGAGVPEWLSPAEKYDLLVGDENFTLTRTMLALGEPYYYASGYVADWLGFCNGWAPAAYRVARPESVVMVRAADGITDIKFYPSDIKALIIALWRQENYPTRFIGWRCWAKEPYRDPSTGRPQISNCVDTNPATWHLVAVNQIGVARRSFIMDATYDYEVWNQPVYGYKYRLFNPKSHQPAETIEAARVSLRDFPEDRFARYRSWRAVSIVGVEMDVTYVSEKFPVPSETDSEADDFYETVRYRYDLELDAQGKIIGGEWYSEFHPDFLWDPAPGVKPVSPGDPHLANDRSSWDGKSPLPEYWRSTARWTSQHGLPLSRVVDELLRLSTTSKDQ